MGLVSFNRTEDKTNKSRGSKVFPQVYFMHCEGTSVLLRTTGKDVET